MAINEEFYDEYDVNGDAPEAIVKCISCVEKFAESETHSHKENGKRVNICNFCFEQENPEDPACTCYYVDADVMESRFCDAHGEAA